jgi:hypothetical protein
MKLVGVGKNGRHGVGQVDLDITGAQRISGNFERSLAGEVKQTKQKR